MKRNKFNLSYTNLFSCDMGELIPCGLTEVLPGDSFQMQTKALVRCAPMLAPPMHPVRVRIHHWFVPNRIVWSNWESFITGGPDGLNASVYPTIAWVGGAPGDTADYLGVPPGLTAGGATVSALPFRGYATIWNEWYRDEDLETPEVVSKGDGADNGSYPLKRCAWEKDYFTSARPWEQKGSTVLIPIGGVVSLTGNATVREAGPGGAVRTLERQGGGLGSNVVVQESGTAGADFFWDLSTGSGSTTGAGVSVNQLRQSLALQRFQEARARYGSRYPEYLRALGVTSSDARLQRPEYLGGGVQTIQFSEVLQTGTDGTNPVSTLRGHGISALRSNRFRRFFEEHGYVITMFSVLPKTIYGDGLFRTWNRRSKFDYWHRELENLGQQAVLNKEAYGKHSVPDGTFGYQDRYDEYRRSESRVGGEFRTSLNYWHFSRQFLSNPILNASFVSAVPAERPFAAASADVLYVQCHHSIQARRLVSRIAVPRTF